MNKAIIVDIDGTLAHKYENREIYDYDLVYKDHVDQSVLSIVEAMQMMNHKVILLTGRTEDSREVTENWLRINNIKYDLLIMRPDHEKKEDDDLKHELFNKYIKNTYNVNFVIEDRPKVVRMWHKIGVKCLAVGNQHIEF